MTEAEWTQSADPRPMLEFLRGRASDRKLRLFGCACVRRIWHVLNDRSRRAVEVAERYADGVATRNELMEASRAAWEATSMLDHFNALDAAWQCVAFIVNGKMMSAAVAHEVAWNSAPEDEQLSGTYLKRPAAKALYVAESAAHAELLGDIFHPFRPASAVAPTLRAWKDGTILTVANRIYYKREFEHLPFLADLLQEAGCSDAEILAHLRSEGPHVRGCWALDLPLQKE